MMCVPPNLHDNKDKMKVKRGCLTVRVGSRGQEGGFQQFTIPISYLDHHLFKPLLKKSQEVYGYNTKGPLKLPCSVDDFLRLQSQIEAELEAQLYEHQPNLRVLA